MILSKNKPWRYESGETIEVTFQNALYATPEFYEAILDFEEKKFAYASTVIQTKTDEFELLNTLLRKPRRKIPSQNIANTLKTLERVAEKMIQAKYKKYSEYNGYFEDMIDYSDYKKKYFKELFTIYKDGVAFNTYSKDIAVLEFESLTPDKIIITGDELLNIYYGSTITELDKHVKLTKIESEIFRLIQQGNGTISLIGKKVFNDEFGAKNSIQGHISRINAKCKNILDLEPIAPAEHDAYKLSLEMLIKIN